MRLQQLLFLPISYCFFCFIKLTAVLSFGEEVRHCCTCVSSVFNFSLSLFQAINSKTKSKTAPKKKVVSEAQWEEWKKKDAKVTYVICLIVL